MLEKTEGNTSEFVSIELQLDDNMPSSIAHINILHTGKHLGYFSEYTGSVGKCRGITVKWIEACLLHEDNVFNQRVTRLVERSPTIAQVNLVKEKVRRREYISSEDQFYLDTIAFYENIMLFHTPSNHRNIFNQLLYEADIEIISQFASSDKILEQGGLATVFFESWIFSDQEIISYFEDITHAIQSIYKGQNSIIGFLLSSSHHNHAIGMSYDIKKDAWKWMDINFWPPRKLISHDISPIPWLLRGSFSITSDMKQFTFSIQTITTAKDFKLAQLSTALSKIKISHVVTAEKTKCEQIKHLVYNSSYYGHIDVIMALALLNVSLNIPLHSNNTPIYIAAQHGHINVITVLASFGANVDTPDNDGVTPVNIAATRGHVEVITKLAIFGANVNTPNSYGCTPVFTAASKGDVKVITELARLGANLNTPNVKGHTPTHVAVALGHVEVIVELIRLGANINASDNDGFTPLLMAISCNQVDAVRQLLLVNSSCVTRSSVIRINILRNMLDNENCMACLNKFITTKFDSDEEKLDIAVSPQELTMILGNKDLIKLFKLLHVSDKNSLCGLFWSFFQQNSFEKNTQNNKFEPFVYPRFRPSCI
ncbi:MAG: hypothetical protein A3F46_10680 [Legionellales bacterium RIFCSPHIGHO2_12_FULL_42_9]|nr:MAG: hypothetical protein A3F46_10680 [Legionellales bacterium RIFCSPHIGHO2_12_FULL_42_9]